MTNNYLRLNLANPGENLPGNINFSISKFPDGQQTVDIVSTPFSITSSLAPHFLPGEPDKVLIVTRLKDFRDLELVIAANKALRNLGVKEVALYSPWFIGARSDRKFKEGGVNYLKDVITPVINSQGFNYVKVLDPHSDVLEACLENFKKVNNFELFDFAKQEIGSEMVLVSPDGGALKKIYDVAEHFQLPNIVTAIKHRDIATGKITHTEVPLSESRYYKDCKFVIVDDICDGGRTFIELAKEIIVKVPDAKIYLVVTHGIFSAGTKELRKYIEKIYTTNSFSDHEEEDFIRELKVL